MALSNSERQWLNKRRVRAAETKALFHRATKGTKVWMMVGKLYRDILTDIRLLEAKEKT